VLAPGEPDGVADEVVIVAQGAMFASLVSRGKIGRNARPTRHFRMFVQRQFRMLPAGCQFRMLPAGCLQHRCGLAQFLAGWWNLRRRAAPMAGYSPGFRTGGAGYEAGGGAG
jgi:hypothetical protein